MVDSSTNEHNFSHPEGDTYDDFKTATNYRYTIRKFIMDIRPICREELETFASFSDRADLNEHFFTYLKDMWALVYVRPEWCFVAEEAGKFIGRIVYWSLRSLDKPMLIDILEVPWSQNYIEVGTNLLQHSLVQLQLQSVEYDLDCTSSDFTSLQKRIELFEHFGFSLQRETIRFEWKDTQTQVTPSNRLTFRSIEEVGEDAFINAIIQVSSQTLDRSILHNQAELGQEQEATERFKLLKALKYQPRWWQLAYTDEQSLIGLILPAENDGGPIIGYIGVVPKHRGKGYVNDLLLQATLTLKSRGATRIRSDTDINNAPMIRAFQSAGYKQFASRRQYHYLIR
ncbi:MAG: GNAT family N-acetyltransferase [Komarekiella atlantica HA4396-MV6]|jgi:RimJ/RimL family protein N-acetyltransferase|nr:GNAT family N-acetyltransferase [Komarekiella atlantica HA4396-MV6]